MGSDQVSNTAHSLTSEFLRSIREPDSYCPREADESLNDASRCLIAAVRDEYGEAWLGSLNYYGDDLPALTRWDGNLVRNFAASYVLPRFDARVLELVRRRHRSDYTGTRDDAARVDAIFDAIAAADGFLLHWS